MIKNKINYSQRKYVIGSIFILVAFILLIKLFIIQIIDSSYKQSSENNTLRYITQYPSRGKIYDRNGKLLVYNDAVYDLMVVPNQVKNIDTLSFCKSLNINDSIFNIYMNKAKSTRESRHQSLCRKSAKRNMGASPRCFIIILDFISRHVPFVTSPMLPKVWAAIGSGY